MSTTPHALDPGYNWTEPEMAAFILWCESRGVQHIDLWRGDLNTLNPVDGTEQWIYSLLAKFVQGTPALKGDDAIIPPASH